MKKVFLASIVTVLFAFPVSQVSAGWGGWVKVCESGSGVLNSYKSCKWAKHYYMASGAVSYTLITYTNGRFYCPKP